MNKGSSSELEIYYISDEILINDLKCSVANFKILLEENNLTEFKKLLFAFEISKQAHINQPRKFKGNHFENHVLPICVEYLKSFSKFHKPYLVEYYLTCILLHDVLEDTSILTLKKIKEDFGNEVFLFIKAISKPSENDYPGSTIDEKKHARYVDYKSQLKKVELPEIYNIKSIDLLQNLSCSLKYAPSDNTTIKYIKKILFLKDILEDSLYLRVKLSGVEINQFVYIQKRGLG